MTARGQGAEQANRRTIGKLAVAAVAMFGFGFALVPAYSVLCKVTGINTQPERETAAVAAQAGVDRERTVVVELSGSVMTGLPWQFRPERAKVSVHPGEVTEVYYDAHNIAPETLTGQAVPSVTPPQATAHLKKIECFCFTRQPLAAGESKRMPVRFVVNRDLPADIKVLTLNYAFFNVDQASSRKYGATGGLPVATHEADHGAHNHAAPAGG